MQRAVVAALQRGGVCRPDKDTQCAECLRAVRWHAGSVPQLRLARERAGRLRARIHATCSKGTEVSSHGPCQPSHCLNGGAPASEAACGKDPFGRSTRLDIWYRMSVFRQSVCLYGTVQPVNILWPAFGAFSVHLRLLATTGGAGAMGASSCLAGSSSARWRNTVSAMLFLGRRDKS